ncbi:hypothetical protein XENORESO_015377 [Xenotaenia resolanae]|uniref:Uncharacterized protein n=1 Tax=Xenotaenia resolanae TaxID=208358 RepID=A0ABV0W3R6_9TELE
MLNISIWKSRGQDHSTTVTVEAEGPQEQHLLQLLTDLLPSGLMLSLRAAERLFSAAATVNNADASDHDSLNPTPKPPHTFLFRHNNSKMCENPNISTAASVWNLRCYFLEVKVFLFRFFCSVKKHLCCCHH